MKIKVVLIGLALLGAITIFFAACGGAQKMPDIDERKLDPTKIPKTNTQKESYDINRDGVSDVYEYYKFVVSKDSPNSQPVPTLVLKELAVDVPNSNINVWRVYKYNGEVWREWFDVNNDGAYEVESFFGDNRLVKKRYDINGDGQPDMWKLFDELGRMTERSIDTNKDGKPDLWEYYDKGNLKETKRDLNGDGKPD